MIQRRAPAKVDPATTTEDTSSISDVLQRVEGSCYQAQEWLRHAVEVLGAGHQMLQSRESPQSPGGALPPSPETPEGNAGYAGYPEPPAVQRAEDRLHPQSTGLAPDGGSPDTAPLRVHCLGKFRVYRGERLIERWRSNKAKGILKLLLLNQGKPLPKDIFMEAFWQDYPVQSAANSFRVALHELRQRLSPTQAGGQGPEYILTDGSNYSINLEAPLWVDFQQFEVHWRAGRALEKLGRSPEAIAEYRAAERLYHGDFLEEDIYEDWTLLKREALVDIHLSILGKISNFFLKTADYDSCIEFSQKILAKDRCREDAYQYLIRCYSNLGFRSRALRWYRLCENTLQRELDCTVSPETRALFSSLSGGGNILGATMLILR